MYDSFLTFQKDTSLVCLVNSHENLHKCRFTGTIFTHQGVYLTWSDLKGNILENLHTRK